MTTAPLVLLAIAAVLLVVGLASLWRARQEGRRRWRQDRSR
ncbi:MULTISPECIES: hypothetical protein [unclassified Nocardioides]|nr:MULTISPECIES: hypothetical protein [unclassified Nocardioides]